uniref:(northern house mosquito) hypothetical protein n=1 Tax=Culex pipiens TaxID=7175 RepID=A0A8D8ESJ5_CULPI
MMVTGRFGSIGEGIFHFYAAGRRRAGQIRCWVMHCWATNTTVITDAATHVHVPVMLVVMEAPAGAHAQRIGTPERGRRKHRNSGAFVFARIAAPLLERSRRLRGHRGGRLPLLVTPGCQYHRAATPCRAGCRDAERGGLCFSFSRGCLVRGVSAYSGENKGVFQLADGCTLACVSTTTFEFGSPALLAK